MTEHCPICGRPESDWSASPDGEHCSQACAQRTLDDTDQQLEEAIDTLLRQRGRDKTICPSEAARRVRPDDWRPLMERTRLAARRLHARGRIEFTRGGEPVDPWKADGPVRLGRPQTRT